MKKYHLVLSAVLAVLVTSASGQISFTDNSSLLNATYRSGGVTGVVDMNGDRLDDIVILDESRHVFIEYQNPDGSFTQHDYGMISPAAQWGAAIGDVDADGHKDIFSGGSYDGVHLMQISQPGTSTVVALNNGAMFMQCANVADINNDGWLDAFGCHDDADSRIWYNDQTGVLNFTPVIDFTTTPASDMSGNYGSCWTDIDQDGDLDLYIAKCRQFVNDPTDPRRINVLFINDGNGNFTDEAGIRGINLGDQSWSADFGDIDNDGDMDHVVLNHDNTIRLFENDGNGFFTEITAGSGLEVTGFYLQSIMRDFDNDGNLDLIISGEVNFLFLGNGDGTFTDESSALASADLLHSFGLGDLNADGFVDYYASYGETYVGTDPNNPDKIWLNDGNANNWAAFELKGTTSNADAIGATTLIYGAWGVQMREVRSGESYGITNSFAAHFGLGAETVIDSVVINWPSGISDTHYNLNAGSYYTVIEGQCIAPEVDIALSTPAAIVCTGGTPLTLTASPGFTYLWSTGETTQYIDVTAGGVYTVTIDDGSGCTNSMSVTVQADPDETPIISSDAGVDACTGDVITLSTGSSTPLSWSTGETSTTIQVTQTSTITVSTVGVCGSFTSQPITIDFAPTPTLPVTTGDALAVAGTATLTATGANIEWYNAQVGGTKVGTGSPWTTPVVAGPTSFWAQDVLTNTGATTIGGKQDQDLAFGGYYNNNNRYLIFEAFESFLIQSVKVYANGAGDRTFAVIEEGSGNVVTSGTFSLPDGESRVNLNFLVPTVGTYSLRSLTTTPDLWRDNTGSNPAYPFSLGSVGSILESNANNATGFYYFFYDWEVAPATQCISDRVEAEIEFAVGIEELTETGISLWPNPSSGLINIQVGDLSGEQLNAEVLDVTGRIVWSRALTQADLTAGQAVLDLNHLAKGDYVLKISDEDVSLSRIFVLQ